MEKFKNNSANSYEAILQETSKSKTKVSGLNKTYPAFIALIIFIALAFYVRYTVKENYEKESQQSFTKAVGSVMMRIENKYNSNLQVLTSIQGLYDQYVEVVRDYFKLYSSVPTSTNASIKSLLYVPRISRSYASEHVFNMQRQALWDYKIYPNTGKDIIYPVEFVEPLDKNIRFAGYDFYSYEAGKVAIEKAKDNNIITSTPVDKTLSMENGGGLYIIAPVYKQDSPRGNKQEREQNYAGVVIQEIDVATFFNDALVGNFPSDTMVVFEIIDNQSATKQIYKSKNFDQYAKEDLNSLSGTEILKVADRDIEIKFTAVPTAAGWLKRNLHNVLFVVTLILAVLIFLFIFSITTSRARAIDLAERMTRSQRRILEASKDIIAVVDMNGNWKSINPAVEKIFNTTVESLIGKNISELFSDKTEVAKFNSLIAEAKSEETVRVDYEMHTADGETKWLSWSFTVSQNDGLVYAIGRDVTLEKLAEQEAILKGKQMQLAEQYTREASEFKSNFMTKLSHQMRNSLTGINGYLQLISMDIYENEEEMKQFIQMAEDSSMELMTFVSDMVDVADGTDENNSDISTINAKAAISEAANKFNAENDESRVTIEYLDENQSDDAKLVVNKKLLAHALEGIINAFSKGKTKSHFQVAISENPYEGATELQIMTDANPLVANMIQQYKNCSTNMISNLHRDKEDILLSIAIVSSNVKMMNGNMSVETFGEEEGNLIQMSLPTFKKNV